MAEYEGYAGRLLADRYRLPLPPTDAYELAESLAWDTASGQEVLVRQVPLPEVVDAEVMDAGPEGEGPSGGHGHDSDHGYGSGHGYGPGADGRSYGSQGRATRRPADPTVRRAVEAAVAAAQVPDHPRLDQVFDVFVEADGLWIVSELVPSRPLAALLAERPLGAHRAAEIAADLLAALGIVHAHGWTHRNITARTVLICEDGRALLTGLSVGAAEEALCGYDPLPPGGGTGESAPDGGPAAGGSGTARGESRGVPGARDAGPASPEDHAGATGFTDSMDAPRPERRAGPATWTGRPLPEGFPARESGPDEGPVEPRGPGQEPGYGPARDEARGRGIFGFEGVDPQFEDGEPQGGGRARDPYRPQGYGGLPGTAGPAAAAGPVDPAGSPGPGDRGGRVDPGDRGDRGGPVGIVDSGGSARQGPRPPVAHGYEPGREPGYEPGREPGYEPGYETGGEGGAPDGRAIGDEISARAARRGAIAAYRAGAQRAAAEFRDGGTRESGARESGPPPGAEDGREPDTDWWSTSSGQGGGRVPGQGGPGRALDDDVRWLPSDEDEVRPGALESEDSGGGAHGGARDEIYGPRAMGPYGRGRAGPASGPTALPGARTGGSRRVPASWQPRVVGTEADAEQEPGRHEGLSIFEPLPDVPYEPDTSDEWDTPPESDPSHESSASYGDGTAYEDDGAPYEGGEPDGEERPWGFEEAAEGRYRGPATALAAERARHARMTVVGPVTERWAPEQAGPVYENWRLAPPVGPAADLWALGALLFRCVQGHAPYPEDSAAELVQMVCAEPPAFAEDCGALRPVVESLMRQDPTERPDFEELRGWLRSLIRSAPEPEVGLRTVTAPPSLEPGGPADPRRLPILRRRGELVRRRRRDRRLAEGGPARRERGRGPVREREQPPVLAPEYDPRAGGDSPSRGEPEIPEPVPGPDLGPATAPGPEPAREPRQARRPRPSRQRRQQRQQRHKKARSPEQEGAGPRRLGRLLLGLVLLGLTAAVLFAMLFMPGQEKSGGEQKGSVVVPEEGDTSDGRPGASGASKDSGASGTSEDGKGSAGSEKGSGKGSGTSSAKAPKGYKMSRDPAGFEIAVPQKWDRRSANGRGQVRYNGGEVEMVLANGRDSTKKFGKDPMAYQSEHEPELAAYRAADWAGTGGLRRIDVGRTAMAEGTFTWREQGGREVYARNRAMILDGRYHVLLVIGSKSHKTEIDRHFEAVADTYRATRR